MDLVLFRIHLWAEIFFVRSAKVRTEILQGIHRPNMNMLHIKLYIVNFFLVNHKMARRILKRN
ncbi:MAG: hypothetical protein CMH58_02230 [Myxococcales bacterium]|nr:hypothetical protein [Myxococcales bacterium]